MATYANGCDVRVGDIVQCLSPDDCKGLLADHNYTVSGVVVYSTSQFVQLSEKCSSLEYPIKWFRLIRRAPAPEPEQPAVNNEQSPPLVVWPEEKESLAFENLSLHELFVFADSHDSFVRQKIGDTSFVTIAFDPISSPNGYHSTLSDRAVRRLLMVQRPQFTVI